MISSSTSEVSTSSSGKGLEEFEFSEIAKSACSCVCLPAFPALAPKDAFSSSLLFIALFTTNSCLLLPALLAPDGCVGAELISPFFFSTLSFKLDANF